MMIICTLGVMFAIAALYIFILLARWTAPLSAAIGFIVAWISLEANCPRGMAYGVGLFAVSTILFMASSFVRK